MKKIDLQFHIGKFIIYSTLFIFVLLLLLYVVNGITINDFADINKILAPIQAVYLTAIIKFMMANKYKRIASDIPTEGGNEDKNSNKELTAFYVSATKWAVYIHALIVVTCIVLVGLGGILPVPTFLSIIPIMETFFGVYIGTLLVDLFTGEEKQ